jgi:hypothetical protein
LGELGAAVDEGARRGLGLGGCGGSGGRAGAERAVQQQRGVAVRGGCNFTVYLRP